MDIGVFIPIGNNGRLMSKSSPRYLLDEVAEVAGAKGITQVFDDFLVGVENLGTRIRPPTRSRERRSA